MTFSASAIFCFTSFTSAKCFPLRDFFIWENKQKKVTRGEIPWGEIRPIGNVGHGGHAGFWSKTAEHLAWCGQLGLWWGQVGL